MSREYGIGPVPEADKIGEELRDFLEQMRRAVSAINRTGVLTGNFAGSGSGSSGGSTTIIVDPGEGGSDEPDLTPPPTPSGADAASGFSSVFFETDEPTFSQGHGYDRTIVYGAKWTAGPLPTFGSAVKVHEFVGAVGSMPSDLGVQWHFWMKWRSKDGVLSSSPAGGTNGIQVTIGKIGNADLGPLIIEAGQLADGAVLTAKIAAGAVGMDQLADNSVSVGKLLVTGRGRAINDDPALVDLSAWTRSSGVNLVHPASSVGANYYECATPSDKFVTSKRLPISPSKQYRLTARLFAATDNDREMLIFVRMYRADGSEVSGNTIGGTGWGGTFAGYVYFGKPPVNTFTLLGNNFGSGIAARPIPSDVTACEVGVWFQYAGGAGAANQAASDIRLEEAVDAALIVDGAVLARHLSAGSIAVGSAAIENGAIRNALIENLAVDSAKLGAAAVTTAKIADAAITTAKIGDAQITTAKIVDASISLAKINTATIGSLAAVSANLGAVAVSTSGYLRSGQTAYDTGSGWWLGIDGSTPKFSIGDAGSYAMTWDGSNLYVRRGGLVVAPSLAYRVYARRGDATATATVRFKRNGEIARIINGSGDTLIGHWYSPTATTAGDAYTLMVTDQGGNAVTSGVLSVDIDVSLVFPSGSGYGISNVIYDYAIYQTLGSSSGGGFAAFGKLVLSAQIVAV